MCLLGKFCPENDWHYENREAHIRMFTFSKAEDWSLVLISFHYPRTLQVFSEYFLDESTKGDFVKLNAGNTSY